MGGSPIPDAGFTLIELLVAMTLLGLLMVALFGGLRFGLSAWERSTVGQAGLDDVRLAQELLRRKLGQAYPLMLGAHVDFDGGTDALRFLAPIPTTMLAGGNGRFSLRLDGKSLVMTVSPELAWDDPTEAKDEVLLTGVQAVAFSYYGGEPRAWQSSWRDQPLLPQLIKVALTFAPGDRRRWPELVIGPRIAVDAACRFDPVTRYCQGR